MDQLRPTIRQIRYFLAVAGTSSFRGAADRLRVSQPTVTQQIIALEEAFGIQLFERSRAGTKLSPAGRELLPAARRVLEEFLGLCDQAQSLSKGPSGTYSLGVIPTLGPYLLPHILPDVHKRYAAIKLYVREDVPRNLEAGLVAGDHDLILTALPVDQDGLTVVPLFHEPLKLVISAEHRLAKKPRIDRQDLAGESILTIEEHHHFHRQIQELSSRLDAHVLRDYEGTSLDTLRQMVAMGMGIAFLPALYIRSEIHQPHELRVATVHDEDIHRTHAFAWRASSPARTLFKQLANEVRVLVARGFPKEVTPISEARSS